MTRPSNGFKQFTVMWPISRDNHLAHVNQGLQALKLDVNEIKGEIAKMQYVIEELSFPTRGWVPNSFVRIIGININHTWSPNGNGNLCKTDWDSLSVMPERWVRCPVCGHERATFAKRVSANEQSIKEQMTLVSYDRDSKADNIPPKQEVSIFAWKKWRMDKYWYNQYIDIVVYARLFVAG